MNTAYNIGFSCNLTSKNMKILFICEIEPKKKINTLTIKKLCYYRITKSYEKCKAEFDSMQKNIQFCILFDEKALLTISEDE